MSHCPREQHARQLFMPDFFDGIRIPLAVILFLALAVALSIPASSQTYKLDSLVIEAPWSRATPGGAKVAGGYLKITNKGTTPDRLVGGSTVVADRFEVHEMAVTDGVMRMRPLKNGLVIAPGATVEFKPGGYHVMFMELKQPLKEGQTVKGTLVFEKAGTVEIDYRVGPIGTSSQGGHGAKGPMPKHGH